MIVVRDLLVVILYIDTYISIVHINYFYASLIDIVTRNFIIEFTKLQLTFQGHTLRLTVYL